MITKFNLSDDKEQQIALIRFNHLLANQRLIELKEIKPTRTNLQNRSLHLFFNIISDELNNLGLEFATVKISKWENRLFAEDDFMYSRYTPEIVKKYMWKPIQKDLFGTDSTKDLTTSQINEISDVIIKFFGEKGIYIAFPSIRNEFDHFKNNFEITEK